MDITKARILVVDDNELNRDMLARRLERAGFDVDMADGGQSGLERILSGAYKLVMLDIMMPDIDGLTVLKRTRERYSKTELPVIMATAKDEGSDLAEALSLGANDYVTKPLDFRVVRARVENVLGYAQAVDELTRANERMNRDLEAAARVQASLLPGEPVDIEGAEFIWQYRPCDELAGDGLNVFKHDNEHVAMYVLDVSGHGVASALLSVSVTHHLSQMIRNPQSAADGESSAANLVSPASLARNLNTLFPMEAVGRHYFTFLYGVLNVKTRLFRFVSAGGPGPLVVHADGSADVHDVPAVPIGMFPDSEYEDTFIELQPGDRLYLHTDGLYEERNPGTREQFGRDRMRKELCAAATGPFVTSLDGLFRSITSWRGSDALSDDIAVLGCAIHQENPG
ncbi:MAG: SpoIIE family protein phosphatase [Gammaproteobacteria bacterium]|jgi:sigma-B regulation protein RsbU (phosphoserine phosphatase)